MSTPITSESFQIRKSLATGSIGNDIDLTASGLINLNNENNLWPAATGAETLAGSNKYKIFYIRFIGGGDVKKLHLNLLQATKKTGYTDFKWAFDPALVPQYHYSPHRTYNGTSDFDSIADTASLRLTQFSIATWFRTSANLASRGYMVNKGGEGSDSAGQNDNYSLAMNSDETLRAGFEEGTGTDHYATSPLAYNDGKWHLAVVTYDQVTIRLYVDGVQVATHATTTTPENTGTNPLVLGRNSRTSANFYAGDLDEVYVWNDDLTADEVADLFNLGTIPKTTNIVYGNRFPGICKKYQFFDGVDDKIEQADAANLDLLQFSVSAWIRFETGGLEQMIVNKGGAGSDSAGENMNYGILITTSNFARVEFETGAGADNVATGAVALNDGKWHHILGTYDQVNLRLYVDGVNVTTTATTATPETNLKPLRVGCNSRDLSRFFNGDIGDVYVWNDDLTATEAGQLYRGETIPKSANIVYSMTGGFDNKMNIAQILTNENTAPVGTPVWKGEDTVIPELPNIGDLAHFGYLPVIGWWSNIAGSPDIENDLSQLNLNYGLPSGQTGSGGNENPNDPQTPNTNEARTMVQGGDWGEENTTEDIVQMILDEQAHLIIDSGDKAYASSPNDFLNIINPIVSKFVNCQGNHDDGSRRETYLNMTWCGGKHFYQGNPAHYYWRQEENIAIIVMDLNISFNSGSTQHTAIKSFLDEIKAKPEIDWIFVTCHQAFFGSANDGHGFNDGNVVQTYFPMFQEAKVAIIFQGHIHNYERSHLVTYNSNNPTSPNVINTSDNYQWGAGIVFVRNGTFGHDTGSALYKFTGSQHPATKYKNDEENGISLIKFTNNNKTLTFQFKTLEGQIRDTFTITRGAS